MENNYPASMAFSYSVKPLPSATPNKNIEKELGANYLKSSKQLICHDEVLDMFCLTSRALYICRKNRGFLAPVTRIPLRWLRSAVEGWKLKIGSYKGYKVTLIIVMRVTSILRFFCECYCIYINYINRT